MAEKTAPTAPEGDVWNVLKITHKNEDVKQNFLLMMRRRWTRRRRIGRGWKIKKAPPKQSFAVDTNEDYFSKLKRISSDSLNRDDNTHIVQKRRCYTLYPSAE